MNANPPLFTIKKKDEIKELKRLGIGFTLVMQDDIKEMEEIIQELKRLGIRFALVMDDGSNDKRVMQALKRSGVSLT
jgi:hypothetical protein